MIRFIKLLTPVATLGLAMAFLAGCGKSTPAVEAEPADGIRTIRISSNDQMRFSVTEIEAAPGEQLRVVHNNFGRMPKQTMGHNWILFTKMEESALNTLAMEAAQNSPTYLPRDTSKIIVKSNLLGPGESDTVVFNAPTEPGDYVFACTFPGHFAMMRGVLKVR